MDLNSFDELDRGIIEFVKRSDGVTIRDIAEAVNRSPQTVRYRTLSLEAERIIKGRWRRKVKFYYEDTVCAGKQS